MAPASTTLLKPLLTSALFFLLFTHAPTCNAQCRTESILYSRETLTAEESLFEAPYKFGLTPNCNLVLMYIRAPLVGTVWTSGTGGLARNCHLTLQPDGNLVLLTPRGRRIWASNTAQGPGDYVLILQKNGNVVIYGSSVRAAIPNLPTLNRNGDMMPAVIINATDKTNNGTTNLIKTVV